MNEITLTKELVDDVVATLCKNNDICKDQLVSAQYLVAIVGYILATNIKPSQDNNQMVQELANFLHHVYDDLSSQAGGTAATQPQAMGDPQQAFGIWKPKEDA